MSYRFTAEAHETYVHARLDGTRTPENLLRYMREAYLACVQHGRSDLLLEMNLANADLDTSAIYRVILQRAADGAKLRRIAYVETGAVSPAKSRFAETVAVNRAVNVRLFPTLGEARAWLESDAGAAAHVP
ncbi:MAG TPA: hypothetical protein VFJ62_18480 [Usitatibacter sp.]|nr:hypothetical protein [Usitatibacter sp.]